MNYENVKLMLDQDNFKNTRNKETSRAEQRKKERRKELQIVKASRDSLKRNQQQTRINNDYQVSTIVKMVVDGFIDEDIMIKTGVSRSFIYSTKKNFGISKPKAKNTKQRISDLVRDAPDFTYNGRDIIEKVGLSKYGYRVIDTVIDIERGTEKGNKRRYRYVQPEICE